MPSLVTYAATVFSNIGFPFGYRISFLLCPPTKAGGDSNSSCSSAKFWTSQVYGPRAIIFCSAVRRSTLGQQLPNHDAAL